MKSFTDKYIDVVQGGMSRARFLEEAVELFPQYVTPLNSYEDVVKILKQRNVIVENVTGVKVINNIPSTPSYSFPEYNLKNAINYELNVKGLSPVADDIPQELYEDIKSKCVENLTKNPLHYIDLIDYNKDRSYDDKMVPLNEDRGEGSGIINRVKELSNKFKELNTKLKNAKGPTEKAARAKQVRRCREELNQAELELEDYYDSVIAGSGDEKLYEDDMPPRPRRKRVNAGAMCEDRYDYRRKLLENYYNSKQ